MKTLVVYIQESYYKYPEIYSKRIYEITKSNLLKIYQLDEITGEEQLDACFREWTYFIIETSMDHQNEDFLR